MTADKVWQTVLGEIELSVSKGSYITWFKNTSLLDHDSSTIIIGVPNIFAKQQLEVKFNNLVADVLKRNGLPTKHIQYKIHSSLTTKRATPKDSLLSAVKNASMTAANPRPNTDNIGSRKPVRQGLNEKYTFESFIVGSGNELAYAACQAIVKSPGEKYNPLFVYGGVGLGKTHLIQAVGNAIAANNPALKVLYVTSETFVQEFLDAIRGKKSFTDRYRTTDVLIVDDMQFIAGKEKTQEEFFHTFNALHQSNKQIIISSDKPPKSIPTLEERLRSRFEWGMTIDMQAPDFETRCAIIQTKASTHNINLSQQVVEYLATHIQTNIRELEGGLNQLLAFCEMRGIEPDLETASELMSNVRSRPKHVTAKQIIERTARHFQIELNELTGPKRDKDIVVPRQIAMYLLRSELHLSFPKVARELGRKDHTTAIHSIDKIERAMRQDQVTREHVNQIKDRLYA